MRRPLIAGNWKMHTTRAEAVALARGIAELPTAGVDVLVCPPYPWLVPVREAIDGSTVLIGAQDCWPEPQGAYTGEVSVPMLSEICSHVIVGHSERRLIRGEEDPLVNRKVKAVLAAGLTPILCVGEALTIRERGSAEKHVTTQVRAGLDGLDPTEIQRCVIAYEPIWAIGTGVSATADDANRMAIAIRRHLARTSTGTAEVVRILYGGSVTAANAAETLRQSDVDGALVGGASLRIDAFAAIVEAAAK